MEIVKNKRFGEERALYNSKDLQIIDCKFDGEEDGESALKESNNIIVDNCYFNLRYPFWHDEKLTINNCELTNLCRAALWYSKDIRINDSKLFGIKALRECNDIEINKSEIDSLEFGWRSKNIKVLDTKIRNCEYLFFESKNINIDNVDLQGKYTFQYVENLEINNSILDTKDAFWHSKNVVVRNSTIKGQYLAWYSEDVTLINCKIVGTQPLCYCKNLKLIDCEMIDTDLAFEYSDVEASIKGSILSVKNPKSGKIVADEIKEIILHDSKIECKCEIIDKSKQ